MTKNELNDFSRQYARIQLALGVKRQVDVARALGVSPSDVACARTRGKIPCAWLIRLFRQHNVNPEWILTGKGLCRLPGPEPTRYYSQEEETRVAEEAMRRIPSRLLAEELVRRSDKA